MKKKGVTLIELIAVIAIASVVLSAIYVYLNSGTALYNKGIKDDLVLSTERAVVMELGENIKKADVAQCNFSDPDPLDTYIKTGDTKILYVRLHNNNSSSYLYVLRGTSTIKQLYKISCDSDQKVSLIAGNVSQLSITSSSGNLYLISGTTISNDTKTTKQFSTSVSQRSWN